MKGSIPTNNALATVMHDNGVIFVSGKWFDKKGDEILYMDRFISMKFDLYKIDTQKKIDDVKEAFIRLYGQKGFWPELPIVREARARDYGNLGFDLPPLAFPLSEKQLIIIKVLLMAGDEEAFFITTGVGGSGKSTFGNIVKQIFGEDQIANVKLQDLGKDFKIAEAINKRLIYSEELGMSQLDDNAVANLKMIVSNQSMMVNPKFKTPFEGKWQASLLFNCNKAPKIDVTDSGFLRRINYFEMNKKIPNPDPKFKKAEYTHEELVNIVAYALATDTTGWRKRFEKETHIYLAKNNSVYLCRHNGIYTDYCTTCKALNLKPFSEPNWREIRELFIEWGLIEDGKKNS